ADLDRAVFAFAGFRTKPAADALVELLDHPHLTPTQRADLIRSYTNYQFDPPLSLEPLAKLLEFRGDDPAEVTVAGLETLAAADSLTGPKATAFVLDLLDSQSPEVRTAAVRAVEAARLRAASGKLLGMLADGSKPAAERVAVLKAVRAAGGSDTAKSLVAMLGKPEPAALKVEALRALAVVAPADARTVAETLLDQPDPTLLGEAVAVLGATKDGAQLVGERYLAKKLPAELLPRVSEVLGKFAADPAIAKLNGDVMRGGLLVALDPAAAERVRNLVFTKGDPKKGKALYLNTAVLACATCHRMEGVGGAIGPDLTRVWDTHTVEKILEAIVAPSKEIKEGYLSYKATTADGRVFTGLRITDTPAEVVIREATGRDVRIPKADLEDLTPLKTSLMPDNAVSQLSFDQFIDLLAFLKSRSAQESLRGAVLDFTVAVGYPADLKASQAPETAADPTATKPPKGDGWVARTADANGLLALKPLLPSTDPVGVFAVAWVYSPTAQKVSGVLLADDPVRVWVGGKLAFERAVPKLQPFATEEGFDATLPAGWSPVVMKVVATGAGEGGPTHRLGLTLRGDGVRTAAKPDAAAGK
ncbi:MAG: hypothetical protein ACRC7O_16400, partial [Fimbriiglobus sp.]